MTDRPVLRLSRWLPELAAALALAGAVFSFAHVQLAPSALWRDDAWQALATRVSGLTQIVRTGPTAPGYAVSLRAWADVAGRSTLALQLPAFVAGMVVPGLVMLLARTLGLHRLAALFAGVLLATSVEVLTYSARVKTCTPDACLSVLAITLSARVLAQPHSRRRWAVLLCAALVALAFSASSAPVFALALAVPAARAVRIGATAVGGYLVVTGLWYEFVLPVAGGAVLRDYWRGAHAFVNLDGGVGSAFGQGRHLIAATLAALLPVPLGQHDHLMTNAFVILVFLGTAVALVHRRLDIIGWCLGPLVVALVLAAAAVVPLGDGRTDIYLYPGIAVLAALPLDALLRTSAPVRLAPGIALTAAALALLCHAAVQARSLAYPVDGLRGVESRVDAVSGAHTGVVLFATTGYQWALYAPAARHVSVVTDRYSDTGFNPAVGPAVMAFDDSLDQAPDAVIRQSLAINERRFTSYLEACRARGITTLWVVVREHRRHPAALFALLSDHGWVADGVRYRGRDVQADEYVMLH